jgi:queuine tRNA-ribosyltransferase
MAGFEIDGVSEAGGRRGRLRLPHGVVETPVFMPVGTAATVKAVPQDVLEEMGGVGSGAGAGGKAAGAENAAGGGNAAGAGTAGVGAQIILANTYHLYLRPGHALIGRLGGVHEFMSWTRPMLTDSGGFQVFSLSKLRKITDEGVEFRSHLDGSKHFFSPEHSMDVQIALGADVAMVFDECVEHPATYERTRASMGLTHAWAARSKARFEERKEAVPWFARLGGATQSLFGIVQGGMYADLRRESAERLVEMELPGYAIGGLAVGEPREVTREMIARTLEWLPKNKPRYVMGVGYPDEIEEYAKMGVDMMDCVLPTRAGRHGLLFTRDAASGQVARMNIKRKEYAEDQGPIDAGCGCRVCARYSRAYLRHLFVAGEALGATLNSIHNLSFYLDTMTRVRAELAADVGAIV